MKLMPLLLLFAACGDDGTAAPQGCQPLLPGECMLPYPSDFFRVPDSTMPSGFHITLAPVAQPKDLHANVMDPTKFWQPDGFSRVSMILATLQTPVTHDGLVGILDDYAMSQSPQSRTLIIDTTTGELVPHYVDIDPRSTKPAKQPIAIYPAIPLAPTRRYIVSLQGLVGADGRPAPAPEGFRKLRDKQVSEDDKALTGIATHFESDVFPAIIKAGVARGNIQLAWDFSTASDGRTQGDMIDIRQQTLAWLDQNPVTATIDSVDLNPNTDIFRTVRGNITVPLFLESPDPGAKLNRDTTGALKQNGTAQIPFIAQVPVSLMAGTTPGRALAYGHGFFGTRDEATAASTRNIANHLGVVLFSIDWWGMSTPDAGKLAGDITGEAWQAFRFTDRVHQGIANWLVMTAAIRGPLAQKMELHRPDGSALYDPGVVYFLGISEGHILGSVMTSLNPDLTSAVFNVGGASWGHMLFRARPMAPLISLLDNLVSDTLVEYEFIALGRSLLDRIDPAIYAGYLLDGGGLPRNPTQRRVLIQTGLGDDEVINAASFLQARQLGIPQMAPNAYAAWGMEQKMAPMNGSAIAVWDFNIDLSYYDDPVPAMAENGVHEGLRTLTTALDQMDQHLRPNGMIVNTCGGVCTSAH
jgi:hypothetical protein